MSFIFSAINRGHCSIYSRVLQIWKPLILEFRKIRKPGDLSQFPVKHHILLCVAERSSHRRCSVIKGVLSNFANFAGKHLAQVFSFEACKISKNTFSSRTPPVAASELLRQTALFQNLLTALLSRTFTPYSYVFCLRENCLNNIEI